jgi:hypothetical protein
MGSGKARELVHDTSLGTWGIPVIVKGLRKTYNIQYFLEDEHDKTLLELLCLIALGNVQCFGVHCRRWIHSWLHMAPPIHFLTPWLEG